ncbi:MAG: hypothetical protein M3Y35_16715 [Actinomycetota bacterium]|nr:hypothetical protein [Actinomycetota bacterium]
MATFPVPNLRQGRDELEIRAISKPNARPCRARASGNLTSSFEYKHRAAALRRVDGQACPQDAHHSRSSW